MDLLKKALSFAKGFTNITPEEEDIIMHCRKTVLVGQGDTIWIKKDNPDFDVPMGSLDASEVSETVGLYLLHRMEDIIPDGRVGLYRDDGLSVIEGNGQEVERIRKKLSRLFKEEGLNITSEGNITLVDFLDVVLDLKNSTYKPFTKLNANTKYVSLQSNHPPAILANLPEAISRRLSSVSSNKDMFDTEVAHYQKALKDAGYKNTLEYKEEIIHGEDMGHSGRRKQRSRTVIWYNPPYSSNVKTNVGKKFLTLLRKHFPPSSALYKLFNQKKVKLSYSCCPSMQTIISSHNAKVTSSKKTEDIGGCNCRGGVKTCPLDGKCLTESLVYKATVSSVEGDKTYIGQAASTFKLRYNNHKNSFTNSKKKHSTALSTYVWNLSRREVDYNINWSIASTPRPYKGGQKTCDLCLMEKTFIARSEKGISLNKRSEIMAKCRHRLPFFLDNFHALETPPIIEYDYEEDQAPEDDIEPQHVQPTQPVLHPPDPLPHLPEVQLDNNLLLIGPVTRSRARKT